MCLGKFTHHVLLMPCSDEWRTVIKGAETINPCTENRKQATAMSLEYVCVFAMDHRLLSVIIPKKKKKNWLSLVTYFYLSLFFVFE